MKFEEAQNSYFMEEILSKESSNQTIINSRHSDAYALFHQKSVSPNSKRRFSNQTSLKKHEINATHSPDNKQKLSKIKEIDEIVNILFLDRETIDNDEKFNKVKTLHHTQMKKENDNYFLELTEGISLKSIFQEQVEYSDPYPLLTLRKKIILIWRLLGMVSQYILAIRFFELFIVTIIVTESVLLVIRNSDDDDIFSNILLIFSFVYGAEMILRIFSRSLKYFTEIWSIVDFLVVNLLLISRIIMKVTHNSFSSLVAPIVMLRLVKINAFKRILMKVFSSLTLLMETIVVFGFFSLLFSISGNLLFFGLFKNRCLSLETGKFKQEEDVFCGNYPCPQGYVCAKSLDNPGEGMTSFDNVLSSMLLIVRTFTMDSWSNIMYTGQQTLSNFSWIYFFSLVLMGSFFLMNLFLTVLKVEYSQADKDVPKIGNQNIISTKKEDDLDISTVRTKIFNLKKLKESGFYAARRTIKITKDDVFTREIESQSGVPSEREFKMKVTDFEVDNSVKRRGGFISALVLIFKKSLRKRLKRIKKSLRGIFTNISETVNMDTISKEKRPYPLQFKILVKRSKQFDATSIEDVIPTYTEKYKNIKLSKISKELEKMKLGIFYDIDNLITEFAEKNPLEISKDQSQPTITGDIFSDYNTLKFQKHSSKDRLFNNFFPENVPKRRMKMALCFRRGLIWRTQIRIHDDENNISGSLLFQSSKIEGRRNAKKGTFMTTLSKTAKSPNLIQTTNLNQKEFIQSFKEMVVNIDENENLFDEIREEYVFLKEEDLKTKTISIKNWSGGDVVIATSFSKNKMRNILETLNYKNVEMWLSGIKGLILHLARFTYMLNKTFGYKLFMVTMDILHFIILCMEGIADKDSIFRGMNVLRFFFFLDVMIKFLSYRIDGYITKLNNIIDIASVVYSVFEFILSFKNPNYETEERFFRSLRTIMVLRVLKLFSYLSYMQFISRVIKVTFKSFMSITLFFYLFVMFYALLGRQIYLRYEITTSLVDFETFGDAFMSVFQVITLDNWFDILTNNFDNSSFHTFVRPTFILILIFLGNMIFFNIFVTILLNGFQEAYNTSQQDLNNDKDQNEEELVFMGELDLSRKTLRDNLGKEMKKKTNKQAKSEYLRDSTENYQELEMLIDPKKYLKKLQAHYNNIQSKVSLCFFKKSHVLRKTCFRFINTSLYQKLVMIILMGNFFILVGLTFDNMGYLRHILWPINCLFMMEMSINSIAIGFSMDKGTYLRNIFNLINFLGILGFLVAHLDSIYFDALGLLLQTLQIFRLVYQFRGARIVLYSVFDCLGELFNSMVPVLLVWLIFAMVGITLFRGKLGYCDIEKNINVGKDECLRNKNHWKTSNLNFENIFEGMFALMVVSTLDGWSVFLKKAVNSNIPELGPTLDNNKYLSYVYFFFFIVVGVWFFLNLVLGTIFFNFTRAEKQRSSSILTPNERKWFDMQKMMLYTEPYLYPPPVQKGFRKNLYQIYLHRYSSLILVLTILINFIMLAINQPGLSPDLEWDIYLTTNSLVLIYIIELVIKVISFGPRGYISYFSHIFEMTIVGVYVLHAIAETLLITYLEDESTSLFLTFRVLKMLRILSLIRIIEFMPGLQRLLKGMIFTLPFLLNLTLILLGNFSAFAIIGCFLFKNIRTGQVISDYVNFKNYFYAMMTLFKCCTADEWSPMIFDLYAGNNESCLTSGCGAAPIFTHTYFISFMFLSSYLLLNVFISVLIQQFEQFYTNPNDPVQFFKDNLDQFKMAWAIYCDKNKGNKIHCNKIVDFFRTLGQPLGVVSDEKSIMIAKKLMKIKFRCDKSYFTHFNDILYATMKNYYREKNLFTSTNQKALNEIKRQEKLFYILLDRKMSQMEASIKDRLTRVFAVKDVRNNENLSNHQYVNIMYSFLYHLMVFRTWQAYAKKKLKDKEPSSGECEECEEYSSATEENLMAAPNKLNEIEEVEGKDFSSDDSD